jgi:hypothetical protein
MKLVKLANMLVLQLPFFIHSCISIDLEFMIEMKATRISKFMARCFQNST